MLCGSKGDDEKKAPSTDGAKLADSNMALYSSPLAKSVRKAAADTEKEWEGAGGKEGVEIWRIENFGVKRWPVDRYGEFYSGDSYIVLETYKPDPEAADLDYNVFFWLGKTTTQDEYGTAAYKTVELDDKLGGEPVQYREVQGQESEDFQDVFPKMKIMEGGVASAFNHVEPEKYVNKLFVVRGRNKKTVKASTVPCDVASLCKNDSYVLDAGLAVFVATFGGASIWEKREANNMVDALQKSRPKCEDFRIDALDEDSADATKFWEILTGGKRPDSLPDTVDLEEKKEEGGELAVFRVADSCDAGKKTEINAVEFKLDDDGKLDKAILPEKDVMIVDSGKTVFIWVGKGASKTERRMAMPLILEEKPEYNKRPIRKYMQGKEKKDFMALFA